MLSKFWIHELTRPAFEEWLATEPVPVAIIGIGSIEQHGPHLPLGTDSLAVREYVHAVAEKTNSICVHPCFPGYSPHHMGFAGTITFSEETLLGVLMDTVGSLACHGIKRFVFLNGHGGNTNILNLALQLAKRKYKVMTAAPEGPGNTDLAKKHAYRQKRYWDVHSGPSETGLALHLFRELVEMERLEDWKPTLSVDPRLMEFLDPEREDHELVGQVYRACVQPNSDDFTQTGVWGINDPRDADPEEGRLRFEEKVGFVTEFIKTWKNIPLPPAFAAA